MKPNLPALLTELEGLLKEEKPCEACGEASTACYDSNGEGLFWLCDARNPVHGEIVYCGILVYRKPYYATKLDERNTLPLLIEALREAIEAHKYVYLRYPKNSFGRHSAKFLKKHGITNTEGR